MSTSWLALVVVAVVASGAASKSYCDISANHQLCGKQGLSSTCVGASNLKYDVTEAERDAILEAHNTLRAKVANGNEKNLPSAANMIKLTWDPELAKIAQAHANKCVFGHDCNDCRKDKNGRFWHVGQNLYTAWNSRKSVSADWQSGVQAWYDEVKDFDASHVSKYQFVSATGHFTQVIWAETSKVGCGFTMFQNQGMFQKLYTCNYGVGGNIRNAAIYAQGSPCSQCPAGTKCDGGLCA